MTLTAINMLYTTATNFINSLEQYDDGIKGRLIKKSGYKLINTLVSASLPFAKRNHFEILEVKSGYIRSIIRLKGNKNHIGTMYAGAQFTLAEIPGGILTILAFNYEYVPVLQKLTIEYLKPARSDVEAIFTLSKAQIDTIREQILNEKHPRFTLAGELTDKDQNIVARTLAEYTMKKT